MKVFLHFSQHRKWAQNDEKRRTKHDRLVFATLLIQSEDAPFCVDIRRKYTRLIDLC